MIRWYSHLVLTLIAIVTLAACGASSRTAVVDRVADANSSALTAEAEQLAVADTTLTATKEPTPVPTPAPTELPTPTPTAIPCYVEADDFLKELNDVVREWNDASILAQNTPRLMLSSHIDQLQNLRRKVVDLSPPSCAVVIRDQYVDYMQVEIDGLLSFLRDGNTLKATNLLGLATYLADEARRIATDLGNGDSIPGSPLRIHSVQYVLNSETDGSVTADLRDFGASFPNMFWPTPVSHEFLAPPGFPLSIKASSDKDGSVVCEIWVDGNLIDRNEVTLAEEQVVCSGVVPEE